MITKIIVDGFYKLGVALSRIINYKLVNYMKSFGNAYYSGWIKNSFNNFKGTPYIEYPIVIIGRQYIEIGEKFETRGRLRIEAWDRYLNNSYTPRIIIGNNVNINYNCHIGAINKIVIGNNVLIASNVLITDHFHGTAHTKYINLIPKERELVSKGPIIIEDNVWIGEGAAIMPGVLIGENSIIGANAVVTLNVPRNCYAVGLRQNSSTLRKPLAKRPDI